MTNILNHINPINPINHGQTKAHAGELKVETKEGEGAKFIIQLPFV